MQFSVTAMSSLNQQPENIGQINRTPVKGLQAFEYQDAELFRKLQREQNIIQYRQAIESRDFSVGVLNGVSGCGKTSFLQAGLKLALEKAGYEVAYVKFSGAPPMESIRQAVRKAAAINLTEETSFPALVQILHDQWEKSWVFLFDQFEQFFTHYRTEKARRPFIAELNSWYQSHNQYPAKILFSVRGDMLDFLYEIQEKLGFELIPYQNYFHLKEFTARQATEIFRAMAVSMQVDFDEQFIHKLCVEELASSESGLISAVDIQILAMMLDAQKRSGNRAFTRQAYEKLGGIDGLLQRFVKEQLDTPSIYNREQDALKVLLALADLDRNVRAGMLTLEQLHGKLAGLVPSARLPDILEWLCSVRLVTKIIEEEDPIAYELAHERLIIPLRNVAGKTLSRIDQASHNLDRRTNEWLGNNRAARYLFNLPELWAIRKYSRLITWEPKRQQKEAFIKTSWLWWKTRLSLATALLIAVAALWIFLETPSWLAAKIRFRDLPQSLELANSEAKREVAASLIGSHPLLAKEALKGINGQEQALTTLLAMCDSLVSESAFQIPLTKELHELAYSYIDSIEPAVFRVEALSNLARVAGKIGDKEKALDCLGRGWNIANEIDSVDFPNNALSHLIKTAEELARSTEDPAYLEQCQRIIESIESSGKRAEAMMNLAIVAGRAGEKEKAAIFLNKSLATARDIEDIQYRTEVMCILAKTTEELTYSTEDIAFLKQGLAISQEIGDAIERAKVLHTLAWVVGLGVEKDEAIAILEQNLANAQKSKDASSRGQALSLIVRAAGEMAKSTKNEEFLGQGQVMAQFIGEDYHRAKALISLAHVAGKIGKKNKANTILEQARPLIHNIENVRNRAEGLRSLARASAELAMITGDTTYVEQGQMLAEGIENAYYHAKALRSLAIAAGKIGKKEQALTFLTRSQTIAGDIRNRYYINELSVDLAKAFEELAKHTKDAAYLEYGRTFARDIVYAEARTEVMVSLAGAAKQLANSTEDTTYLNLGKAIAQDVGDVDSRAMNLFELVATAVELAKRTGNTAYLEQGEVIAQAIDEAGFHIKALKILSRGAGQMKSWKKAYDLAQSIPVGYRAISYAWILRLWDQRKRE